MEIETIGKLIFARKSLDVTIMIIDSAKRIDGDCINKKEKEKILNLKSELVNIKHTLERILDE